MWTFDPQAVGEKYSGKTIRVGVRGCAWASKTLNNFKTLEPQNPAERPSGRVCVGGRKGGKVRGREGPRVVWRVGLSWGEARSTAVGPFHTLPLHDPAAPPQDIPVSEIIRPLGRTRANGAHARMMHAGMSVQVVRLAGWAHARGIGAHACMPA